jgi:hypothetical protein
VAISYDRTGDEELLKALELGGWAHSLVKFGVAGQYALDLQLRGYATKSDETWATLYVGLTKVLDLRYRESKGFRLRAPTTWATSKNGWRPSWESSWQPQERLEKEWPDVDLYLERVIPTVNKQFLVEGAIQSAISGFICDEMLVIDREAALTYTDQPEKNRVKAQMEQPLLDAISRPGEKGWRASMPSSLGGECDALAIDRDGTLLAIEIKPRSSTSTIRWSPLQARHYANLFSRWASENRGVGEDAPNIIIEKMAQQRKRLGLIRQDVKLAVQSPIRVQPLIVIGRGYSEAALEGLREVQGRLDEAGFNDPPLLVTGLSI